MVSSCTLYLDELELTEQKAFVPDFMSALFQESDRHENGHEEFDGFEVKYTASRDTILKRLDLMGCTEELCKQRFNAWRDQQQQELAEFAKDDSELWGDSANAMGSLSWDEWSKRVPRVLETQYQIGDVPIDETDENLRDGDPSWLWFDGLDSLVSIRAILGASTATKAVVLDVSDLISAGWIKSDEPICGDKVRVVSERGQPVGPTVILAEGKSDISILRAALTRFHPDLIDFVTFLDHSEFKVDGGASYVVKFLKAFAAARVPANVIAVFDNDAAGQAALRDARALNLPANMCCIALPDIDLASDYPTVGPQGSHKTNINGKACGIELYLGRSALTKDGTLQPVRWVGYNNQTHTYQGEIEDKSAVQSAFLAEMSNCRAIPDHEYPEMRSALAMIVQAAIRAAEASQNAARPRRGWG